MSREIYAQLAHDGNLGKAAHDRVRRDAFLYMGPGGPDFAQCGSCGLFRPKGKTCAVVVGRIVAEGSCGLYAAGPSRDDQPQRALVSQDAAGYVVRAVRCENCRFFDPGECALYRRLNETLPELFALDTSVDPLACCNAQEPMSELVGKSSEHSDLHVQPENAIPIWGIPIADVVTRANVQHISWELVREGKTNTTRERVPLADIIATQQVVDRQRVDKHEQMLRETGETEPGQKPPLTLLWDDDLFLLGGHHGIQAAYNLGVKEVEVDVMMAPTDRPSHA